MKVMAETDRAARTSSHVVVPLTQQQYVVLEKLRAEGRFGKTDDEILRRVFSEFIRQEGR